MTREIKFRAWDKPKCIMFYDIQNYYDTLGYYILPTEVWDCFGSFLDSESHEVMQYTGLKDKNGKEIYEGDIVEYRYGDNSGGRAKVIYREGCFEVGQGYASALAAMLGGIEVIGNIYEGLYSGEKCDIVKE